MGNVTEMTEMSDQVPREMKAASNPSRERMNNDLHAIVDGRACRLVLEAPPAVQRLTHVGEDVRAQVPVVLCEELSRWSLQVPALQSWIISPASQQSTPPSVQYPLNH